ncbi:hypothetical protein Ahy_B08g093071 isoform B [Arachis hypogaea]|uniref:Uncharacterized protein n=1 Tax=Arachis hypogaea TaxID=3818 RepID=A0A444Y585_ARAHY|nr:hypothetical protein Ahy_B08g093071 isoform B [Arachis hypogaea]
MEYVQVEERLVSVDELLDADKVFCTGTAVVVSPVGSVTYLGNRVSYGEGIGAVSQQLYSVLTRLQMGITEDVMNWTFPDYIDAYLRLAAIAKARNNILLSIELVHDALKFICLVI